MAIVKSSTAKNFLHQIKFLFFAYPASLTGHNDSHDLARKTNMVRGNDGDSRVTWVEIAVFNTRRKVVLWNKISTLKQKNKDIIHNYELI